MLNQNPESIKPAHEAPSFAGPCAPGAQSAARAALVLGALAVVFWSFGSSLVFLGARELGTWRFVALSSLAGGCLQLLSRRAFHGELRTAIRLPWRLWMVPVSCFVLYGVAWPWALAISTPQQVFGVSLINYLWPVLTVLLSAWLVPGARVRTRTFLALVLALAGLISANLPQAQKWLSAEAAPEAVGLNRFLPYGLALVAAVTWALYSAVLARWREWAGRYVTSPIGFLLIGLLALAVMVPAGTPPAAHTSSFGYWMTVLYAVGPLAAGYLLWEMALARGNVHALSLLAAATPVLSTLLLCCFLRSLPGPELILAALLVSAGAVLSLTA